VKSDKFHNSKVQNQEREDQEGDNRSWRLLLPQSISRGRRRCRTDQEENVVHEHAGGPWRTNEGRMKGGQKQKETSWPNEHFWPPGSKPESKVVTKDGREFDLKYRFEDAHGDRGQHRGQRGHFREGERTKATAAAATAVTQQMDEKVADGNDGDTDNDRQPCQPDHQDGGAQPGSTTRDGVTAGNLAWISSARAAQEAVGRMLLEEAPRIGYCHECGWWLEDTRN
jgi:hypothetical protein